jgi:hypothetical protein
MTRRFGYTALLVAAAFLVPQGAFAAAQCADRDKVVKTLADRYGETRQSVGLAPDSAMMEVYASTATGTWTITVTMPNGMTCLVASGEHFEAVAEAPKKPGEDA